MLGYSAGLPNLPYKSEEYGLWLWAPGEVFLLDSLSNSP